MKQQDIFIWMLKTMQKGRLPAYYSQQQNKANLIHIPYAAAELGLENDSFLIGELMKLGFITDEPPICRTLYYTVQDRLVRKKDITNWDFQQPFRVEVEMYHVTSLVELRKRFGKVDPDGWPDFWQEWQFAEIEEPEDESNV